MKAESLVSSAAINPANDATNKPDAHITRNTGFTNSGLWLYEPGFWVCEKKKAQKQYVSQV
jgi:hypothetical protein